MSALGAIVAITVFMFLMELGYRLHIWNQRKVAERRKSLPCIHGFTRSEVYAAVRERRDYCVCAKCGVQVIMS